MTISNPREVVIVCPLINDIIVKILGSLSRFFGDSVVGPILESSGVESISPTSKVCQGGSKKLSRGIV